MQGLPMVLILFSFLTSINCWLLRSRLMKFPLLLSKYPYLMSTMNHKFSLSLVSGTSVGTIPPIEKLYSPNNNGSKSVNNSLTLLIRMISKRNPQSFGFQYNQHQIDEKIREFKISVSTPISYKQCFKLNLNEVLPISWVLSTDPMVGMILPLRIGIRLGRRDICKVIVVTIRIVALLYLFLALFIHPAFLQL